jgi:predicted ATP-grasp superfamily ATP-dependent carboligase
MQLAHKASLSQTMPLTKQSRPTILITDAGRGSALAFIRSLGRQGWRIIAADADPYSLGFRSRYVHEKVIYPSPHTAPREMVATLLKAVQDLQVDLLIPVTDAIILPLTEQRAHFERICQVAIADAAALKVVTNKSRTLALAESLGVPIPGQIQVETVEQALAHAPALGWPVVLKPLSSYVYHNQTRGEALNVCYASNPQQLTQQMQRFVGRCSVLLQAYCTGVGLGIELLMYQGRALAAFQHKRLREIPMSGGASAFRESVPLDPVLYQYARQLLAALQWTGLAMVEFKLGSDGPKLMEINGRIWGSLPLAVHSGMDFPARLARLYLEGPPEERVEPDHCYTSGVRTHNLELDILWIAAVLRGKQRYPFLPMPSRSAAIVALLELFNPGHNFDILSREDPQPGIAEIVKIARKLKLKAQTTAV